jgi:hypothetical protein
VKPSEAALVLTKCAAFDSRTIGEADAIAWAEALSSANCSLQDSLRGVTEHYTTTSSRIMPLELINKVRAIRQARIKAAGEPDYPPDLTVAQERGWRAVWLAAVESGSSDPKADADEFIGVLKRPELVYRDGLKAVLGSSKSVPA